MKTRLNKVMSLKKILVPSFDFKPQLGGVAHYVQELLLSLTKSIPCEILIMARDIAGSTTYDQVSSFKTIRIKTPDTALLALPLWTWNLRKLINAYQPDLIFCPLWFPDASATNLALQSCRKRIPFYIAAHAMELFDDNQSLKGVLRKTLLSSLKKSTFRNCQAVFPVSNYTANLLKETVSVPSRKIIVASNGVNLEKFSPASSKTKAFLNKKTQLLTVTRLRPYKGIDMVLRALPDLIKDGVSLHYNVVGTGPDLNRLTNIVSDLKLEDHVSFHGALPDEKIVQFYQQSDLFILLSRQEGTDVEGFGLVFLEAAACGLPSLGGRSGGIPDAIAENKTGWLVNPTSLAEVAQTLRNLTTNPQLLTEASQQCLEHVKQHTWASTAKTISGAFYET